MATRLERYLQRRLFRYIFRLSSPLLLVPVQHVLAFRRHLRLDHHRALFPLKATGIVVTVAFGPAEALFRPNHVRGGRNAWTQLGLHTGYDGRHRFGFRLNLRCLMLGRTRRRRWWIQHRLGIVHRNHLNRFLLQNHVRRRGHVTSRQRLVGRTLRTMNQHLVHLKVQRCPPQKGRIIVRLQQLRQLQIDCRRLFLKLQHRKRPTPIIISLGHLHKRVHVILIVVVVRHEACIVHVQPRREPEEPVMVPDVPSLDLIDGVHKFVLDPEAGRKVTAQTHQTKRLIRLKQNPVTDVGKFRFRHVNIVIFRPVRHASRGGNQLLLLFVAAHSGHFGSQYSLIIQREGALFKVESRISNGSGSRIFTGVGQKNLAFHLHDKPRAHEQERTLTAMHT
uniref:(northern house mosquito) hypothetical protein n=1 Tax=Culex pipiens TaxID=7175 RepID=A0A8D8AZH5_CULPI